MENIKFNPNDSLSSFQKLISDIYALPDDRLYSIWDLLTQQQRFAMRALKGIRKGNREKLKNNLTISFAWLMAIANRMHVDIEDETWQRFPGLCSYCGHKPCACKLIKPDQRLEVKTEGMMPQKLRDFQQMFGEIYPANARNLADAGVHLAEEMGEVSEAIHNFLGEHKSEQFDDVALEMADYVSCTMGVANSAQIDMASELAAMFSNNCHVCHQAPCECSFSAVTKLKS